MVGERLDSRNYIVIIHSFPVVKNIIFYPLFIEKILRMAQIKQYVINYHFKHKSPVINFLILVIICQFLSLNMLTVGGICGTSKDLRMETAITEHHKGKGTLVLENNS